MINYIKYMIKSLVPVYPVDCCDFIEKGEIKSDFPAFNTIEGWKIES